MNILSNKFHWQIWFIFMIICNYPWRPHVAAATWQYAYLFTVLCRVLKTLRVSDNFHSRFLAQQRTYVYRICVTRQPQPHVDWAFPYPPYELYRSWLIKFVFSPDVSAVLCFTSVCLSVCILEASHFMRYINSWLMLNSSIVLYLLLSVCVENSSESSKIKFW